MKSFSRLAHVVLLLAVAGATPLRAADTTSPIVHETRGVIRKLDPDLRHALIRHEAIPGYMPAMTMEFNVRDTNELAGLGAGDTISFRLTADAETHWIDRLRKIGGAKAATVETIPVPPKPRELTVGDAMPDHEFLAENGQPVRFSDFRGRAVAFTFIFTRCPLPDFCPRMGNHFAATRELLLTNSPAITNWQFLSISFDPEFDTPDALKRYADFYRQEVSDRWLFAVASKRTLATLAPQLDLIVTREEGGSLSHNLRTVVLDPAGIIRRQFDHNEWTPEQLAEALKSAAGRR